MPQANSARAGVEAETAEWASAQVRGSAASVSGLMPARSRLRVQSADHYPGRAIPGHVRGRAAPMRARTPMADKSSIQVID